MYKDNKLIKKVLERFDYVVFDSLGFVINKEKRIFKVLRSQKKFFFLQHTWKYFLKVIKFRPKEVTMIDYHKSYLGTILMSIPLYLICILKDLPFNIVVWNPLSYKLFKLVFFKYQGVSIATGWDDLRFIDSVINKEKHIHCFGVDGKEVALKNNLRYDTFEWLKSIN